MEQVSEVNFKQAVELAQSGKKKEAYAELIKLSKASGGKDSNLLLWIAFTTPEFAEAETALNMVETLEPANPNLPGAKEWYKNELKQREELKKSGSLSSGLLPQNNQPLSFPAFSSPPPEPSPAPARQNSPASPYISLPGQAIPDFAASSPAQTPQNLPYSPLPVSQPVSQPVNASHLSSGPHLFSAISRKQGFVLIGLLAFILCFSLWNTIKPEPKWEYKTVTFLTSGNEREGTPAFNYSSINLDQKQLASLGGDGWELVSDYLEMETAFPNFGSPGYVTGIQPNIRPQSLVLIFKRRA